MFGEDVTVFGKEMRERQAASQGRREAAAAAKGAQETGGSGHSMDMDGVNMHNEIRRVE